MASMLQPTMVVQPTNNGKGAHEEEDAAARVWSPCCNTAVAAKNKRPLLLVRTYFGTQLNAKMRVVMQAC